MASNPSSNPCLAATALDATKPAPAAEAALTIPSYKTESRSRSAFCPHNPYFARTIMMGMNNSEVLTTISAFLLVFPSFLSFCSSRSRIIEGLCTRVTIFHHFITILLSYVLSAVIFKSFTFPLSTTV